MNRVLLFLLIFIGIIVVQNIVLQEHFAEQQCVDPVSGQVRTETVPGNVAGAAGTTGAAVSSSASAAPPSSKPEGETAPNRVFYVKNQYTLSDTERVCSMYGARVATLDNLQGAYNRGANWCSWGWLADGSVAYPVQKSFWKRVERTHKGFCGPSHGINLKKEIDPDLQFGVLCYGVPPPGYKDPRHTFPKPKRTIQRQQDECMDRKAKRERERWEREQRKRTNFVDYTIPIE